MQKLTELLKTSCPMVDFNKGSLMTNKVIDSMDIIKIIAVIENEYGIGIEFDMITAENFDSIEAMMAMINKLKKQ